jgi:peptidylprolyl isomerase
MFTLKKLVFLLLPFSLLLAEEKKVDDKSQADIAKISEAFGHLIGKNIESLGVNFDVDRVAQGLKDASEGKNSPMTEEECVKALTSVQEALFKKQAESNLASAETFLSKNAKEKGVIVLHDGKLQYKIEKKGEGAEVQPHFTPFVRYTGKYLNGSVFGASKEGEPLSLDETIPGIQEGLVGMKEGEKRTLFIHPNLAYGTSGFLPPNSLLTFEVELVKANMDEANKDLAPSEGEKKIPSEIADPFEKRETLR